jgi:transposase
VGVSVPPGVEPTNNRAERALRFGVQWRKRSLGTARDKGNRWVERILSLKETCRLRSVATSHVLVEAIASFFTGQQPDLACLQ